MRTCRSAKGPCSSIRPASRSIASRTCPQATRASTSSSTSDQFSGSMEMAVSYSSTASCGRLAW